MSHHNGDKKRKIGNNTLKSSLNHLNLASIQNELNVSLNFYSIEIFI